MPQAFAAVGAFIAQMAVGAGIATGITSATVIGTIGATIVFGAGAWALSSLLMPRPRNPNRGADAQSVVNQALGPRIRVYGRAKIGGTRAFFDSKDGQLYQIIMLAAHLIDAIEEYWVSDKLVTVNFAQSGAAMTYPFTLGSATSKVRFRDVRMGGSNQSHSVVLAGIFPQWTDAHRLRGIAYVLVQFVDTGPEDFQTIFPQGHNTPIRCVIRGARVYDPRDPDMPLNDDWVSPVFWEWSDNPALCILDYIRCPDGMNKPASRIDFASFANFAWLCDEPVPLKAGGTEKRYRLGGTIALTEDPVDVLQRMLATCDGQLYQTSQGKIAIRGGKWEAPTVTIDANSIIGIDLAEGNDAFSAFNELKVVYTSPLHDYQPQETVPWVDTAEQAAHGQIVEDYVLDMVQSPSQARRLAKIYMHKQNPALQGSIVTNLAGLNALGEATVDCVIPELMVAMSFLTTGFSLRSDLTGCEIGISSIGAAAYDWDPATEEGDNPPPPQDTAPDPTLPVPEGLTLSIDGGDHVVAQVDDPGREDLTLEAQIKAGAGGTYTAMTVDPETPLRAVSAGTVSSGTTYYVRARWVRDGFLSAWTAEQSVTAP